MSIISVLTPALLAAFHAVTAIAAVLAPVLGGLAPATAIVAFTALVRLGLHPLNRAQFRAQAKAEQARAALAPAVAKLQRRHKNDPARVQRETLALYRESGVSLTAGILPALAQMPVLLVMYRLFLTPTLGATPNTLLTDRLFGVGLGTHLADALAAGPAIHLAVFAALLVAVAAVATWSYRRAQDTVPNRWIRLLPFGTVLAAAVVPLATGLYLATTTLWSVAERRYLSLRSPAAAG